MKPGFIHIGLFVSVCVLTLTINLTSDQGSQTSLRRVLNKNSVPIPTEPDIALEAGITSFSVLNKGEEFLIAYYVEDVSGALTPPLHLLGYNRVRRRWNHVEMRADAGSGRQAVAVGSECFGSVLRIYRGDDSYFIDTHINPSAGCLLVFDRNLRLRAALFGWYMGSLGRHIVIFHDSQIHFAPHHPMEISSYDLRTGVTSKIYPPPGDALRARFIRQLHNHLASDASCNQGAHACDPTQFTSDLASPAALNKQRTILAFLAEFEADDFGPLVAQAIPKQRVLYVYRLNADGRLGICQLTEEEATIRLGSSTPENLVKTNLLEGLFTSSITAQGCQQTSGEPQR